MCKNRSKYHIVETVTKSSRKSYKQRRNQYTNTQIHDRSFFLVGYIKVELNKFIDNVLGFDFFQFTLTINDTISTD